MYMKSALHNAIRKPGHAGIQHLLTKIRHKRHDLDTIGGGTIVSPRRLFDNIACLRLCWLREFGVRFPQ